MAHDEDPTAIPDIGNPLHNAIYVDRCPTACGRFSIAMSKLQRWCGGIAAHVGAARA